MYKNLAEGFAGQMLEPIDTLAYGERTSAPEPCNPLLLPPSAAAPLLRAVLQLRMLPSPAVPQDPPLLPLLPAAAAAARASFVLVSPFWVLLQGVPQMWHHVSCLRPLAPGLLSMSKGWGWWMPSLEAEEYG